MVGPYSSLFFGPDNHGWNNADRYYCFISACSTKKSPSRVHHLTYKIQFLNIFWFLIEYDFIAVAVWGVVECQIFDRVGLCHKHFCQFEPSGNAIYKNIGSTGDAIIICPFLFPAFNFNQWKNRFLLINQHDKTKLTTVITPRIIKTIIKNIRNSLTKLIRIQISQKFRKF